MKTKIGLKSQIWNLLYLTYWEAKVPLRPTILKINFIAKQRQKTKLINGFYFFQYWIVQLIKGIFSVFYFESIGCKLSHVSFKKY